MYFPAAPYHSIAANKHPKAGVRFKSAGFFILQLSLSKSGKHQRYKESLEGQPSCIGVWCHKPSSSLSYCSAFYIWMPPISEKGAFLATWNPHLTRPGVEEMQRLQMGELKVTWWLVMWLIMFCRGLRNYSVHSLFVSFVMFLQIHTLLWSWLTYEGFH